MLWSPAGPTVQVTDSATLFANGNLGGVVRLVNTSLDVVTFSIGGPGLTNTQLIPLAIGQDIIVAYGPGVTHAISSAATGVFATPGIGRP